MRNEIHHEHLKALKDPDRNRLALIKALLSDPDVLLLSHPLDHFSREEGRKYLNFVKRWVDQGGLWLGDHSRVKGGKAGGKEPVIFQRRPRTVLIADDLLRDELASEYVDDVVVIPAINKRRERNW